MSIKIEENIMDRARVWLDGNYDKETKEKVQELMENDKEEFINSFYKNLEFGTGGMRGIMGVGTNKMNKYTVGSSTQGLANYLKKMFTAEKEIKVAIAFDSRNNSEYFAKISAEVLSANGIKVYIFDALRPTPELSFAIRYLKCQSGIVITASHNPKEYNGYKVYWDDGGQLVNPHDTNVIQEVNNIRSIDNVNFNGDQSKIEYIGENIDKIYIEEIKKLSLSPESIKNNSFLKIVYTPIHGTGVTLVPRCLKEYGFNNVTVLEEQSNPDGNFPTVVSPNPEERAALDLALKKAREIDADLVLATDPDADRVGMAVKDNNDEFILLNGNQAVSLLIYYLIKKWKEKSMIKGQEYIIKTIVTTELVGDIARKNDIDYYDVFTGFKYIAEVLKKFEGIKTFIGGGEESYGYLVSDFVRDKDAVISCAMFAEIAAWAKDQNKTLYDVLIDIYHEHAFYKEKLLSVVRKGKSGAEEIKKMMDDYRNDPFKEINNSEVILIKDYLLQKETDRLSGLEIPLDFPKSNVLQFFLK
ncbi:MAG: phospho-sugar mutase, partial [Bacteroidales bacterium]|nr:phospho-sugar mutase [Bacteroidales bacterium]